MTACAQLNCMPVGDEDYDGNNGWQYIVNGEPPGLGGWDHGSCWEPGLPHSVQEGGDAHHFTGISDQTCWNNLVTLGRMPRESPSTFRFGFDQADPTQWDAPLHPVCGLEHDGAAPSPPGGEGNGHGCFTVTFGPCTVSDSGRCVGRPDGYLPSETCAITVDGGGGTLGACGVFDMTPPNYGDYLTLPDGSTHVGSDCPTGVALLPGDSVGWTSSANQQGTVGRQPGIDNGCAASGLCGLSYSNQGLGGGWQICFV